MTAGLSELFRDTLACLGVSAHLQQNGHERPIRILIRQPESWVDAGDPVMGSQLLSSRFEGEIMIQAVPTISWGDILRIHDHYYKIFQEPLKDPSGTVWKVHGMRIEGVL